MSLTAPNPIVKPFCNSGTQVSPPVGADTFVANQETGFPDSQATPLPIGTEVQQNEMNGVLRLYTSLLLWLNSGGQFTFNQAFSDANNGYALDNILWCASNSTFQRSLVANNTANFVTTPSYINDGINWIDVNNASFPDIQDNPTTGNVTIGGRVPNSANNIRTLGVNGTGYAGLSTANASTQLYATEADGTTINTGIVNSYGYRTYHTGTATAILDPAITYAYVSELPVVTSIVKNKTFGSGALNNLGFELTAVYDGSVWGCTISGNQLLDKINSQTFITSINLSLVGVSGIIVGSSIKGTASIHSYNGTPPMLPLVESMAYPSSTTEITCIIEYQNPNDYSFVNCAFSLVFKATTVT